MKPTVGIHNGVEQIPILPKATACGSPAISSLQGLYSTTLCTWR